MSLTIGNIIGVGAGRPDPTFSVGAGFNAFVNCFAEQSNNKILCGGAFTTYSGITANRIIRLNTDGSIDNTFSIGTGFNNTVRVITIQSDNKILVGGDFTTYSGLSSSGIIRLNTDGSKDNTFNVGSGVNGIAYTMAIQSDGKIVVGGNMFGYSGTTLRSIVRLNTDGSIDNTFDVLGPSKGFNLFSFVYSIKIQSDGKILAGGTFTTYSGITANRIIRLNTNGSRDNSFSASFDNNGVISMEIQSDGKIICAGNFFSFSGITANRIVRLNTNGSRDNSFVLGDGFNTNANSVAIQSDNKIMVGGVFTTYQNTGISRIIRLNSDATIDISFCLGGGFNSNVNALIILSSGDLIVGGNFTAYQNLAYNRIIKIKGGY